MSAVIVENLSVAFPISRAKAGATSFQRMLGRGVTKGSFLALDNISFSLESGDRLALLGGNGSGKSTLLKVLAQVLPPSVGVAKVYGQVFPALTPAPNVLPRATCEQNILLQGMLFGMSGRDLLRYVDSVRDFSKLGDFLNSPYNTLSAGMKSRFAIATLNSVEPDLLFMDEWVGAADKKVLEKNNGLLAGLISRSDIFVLASHRKDIVLDYCNKALVLDSGSVSYFGDVEHALKLVG